MQFDARDILRAPVGDHHYMPSTSTSQRRGGPLYGKPNESLIKHRVNGRLPRDHVALRRWLDKKIAYVEEPACRDVPLHRVILDFQEFIEKDAVIYLGFHQMFEQVPNKPPYNHDPTGKPQVRDYRLMLRLLNDIISIAPAFEDHGFVGFPINAILDWPMGTPAGMAMFSRPDVNAQFRKIFDIWAAFLDSEESTATLNRSPNGWFGPQASKAMPNFVETYICDPSLPHHGFKSSNLGTTSSPAAFAPVACESTVYRIAHNVQKTDTFWLKGQPYSLDHMLDFDEDASRFYGGTVYQAFLPAIMYHRWHAPVSGRVLRVTLIPGTYYAESPSEGFPDPDAAASCASQAFLTCVATRALIFIESNNPKIGLMCFMAVGMAEVSTCETTVQAGDVVRKGDEIGMFHYGGSTHCLIFRPETKIKFAPDVDVNADIKLNVPIAHVC
ncbi:hypothetical protein PYCCODRAFT_1480156 [Trametes coccinea BRFM310]|uniref:L-tryptophan decarboxylase PsiD-like domain-containing protein n=1 Tax=Trametes coccinea (strain BRFM310) TaxID=1353009 RepID=A0A1Y2ID47_TRAC3|nr:hypothetical protein PYCCODRAFT_1480156 [Trametes coccinea BRFM310]